MIKKRLTEEASNWLIRPVSALEVKRVVCQFSPDKAPEADGSNAHFFQKHWSIVGKRYYTSNSILLPKLQVIQGSEPTPF